MRAYLQVDPVELIEITSRGLDSPVEPCLHRAPGLLRAAQPCRTLQTQALPADMVEKPGNLVTPRGPWSLWHGQHVAVQNPGACAGTSSHGTLRGRLGRVGSPSRSGPAPLMRMAHAYLPHPRCVCRSMTSLNSEFHAPFRHRPENFFDASQKRYLKYRPSNGQARTVSAMMLRYRERSEAQIRNLSNHSLRVAAAHRQLFLIASELVKQRRLPLPIIHRH